MTKFTDFSLIAEPASVKVSPLRVLMVAVRYYPFMGGVETHIYEVARRMAEQGVAVTVITHDPEGTLPAREVVNGVEIRRLKGWPKIRDFVIAPDLYRTIGDGSWDVVHCQGYHTLFTPLGMLASWRAKVPYLVSFHSGGHSSKLRQLVRGVQRSILRPLLAKANRLVAVSQFEADFFAQKLHLPADKFVVIPNGSKLPKTEVAVSEHEQRDQLILSVGRLERYKGHHRVIEAFPQVLAARPNTRLRIVGAGPYEAELQRLVSRLGLNERVEIGAIPPSDRLGMADLMSRAALVTLLSEYEAHPITVMEALSMGRPVLVAATSGLQELADRGLVRSLPLESKPDVVAREMVRQLDQPFVPDNIELPTWEECTARLVDLYRSIVKQTVLKG